MSSLVLETQDTVICKIHPVVIFSIIDHFVRRHEHQYRVIGALIGSSVDNEIEIKNCFPVPHSEENEEPLVDKVFYNNMYNLYAKANPKEKVVGWYCTGVDINENSAIIHEFFWNKIGTSPLLLTVDTELKKGDMDVSTYIVNPLLFGNETAFGSEFCRVPHSIASSSIDKNTMEILLKNKNDPNAVTKPQSELESIDVSLSKLKQNLDTILEYVTNVIEGKEEPDSEVGRFLAEIFSSIPEPDNNYNKILNNSLLDLLMIIYLTNLTRTQLKVAQKLTCDI
eukprot:TRINITY_DN524_c1_g4_i1.p1 TRINITY_DN524_c1_g4~~TRINITY_DN524_c1_g4_i1.p1  ORF type:complete len:282 (-),score=35.19 TRINITY_DN524_c1_g4_i1:321-1166(-)